MGAPAVRFRSNLFALIMIIALSASAAAVSAQTGAATNTTGITVPAGGCEYVYNQSGVYICLPSIPSVNTTAGSVVVRPHNNTYLELYIAVFGFGTDQPCLIEVDVLDANGTPLYSYTNEMAPGTSVTVGVLLPQPEDYVVMNVTLCGVIMPLYAVALPKPSPLSQPPYGSALVALLASLIPVAPVIGLMLRGELAAGGLATLAALPLISILAYSIAPDPAKIPAVIAVSFISALMILVASRR